MFLKNSFQLNLIYSCPEDYKLNPGAVECISEHPTKPNLLLIGYNKGLTVVWNRDDNRAQHTFVSNQQLESVCWHKNGTEFTSSHNDGSYMSWDLSMTIGKEKFKEPVTLYGPYACKAVTKILKRTSTTGEEITILSGMF